MATPRSETSFDSYEFNYQWKVNNVFKYLRAKQSLKSPEFSSPSGSKYNPATLWQMELFQVKQVQGKDNEHIGVRIFLRSCEWDECWTTAQVKISCSPGYYGILGDWKILIPQNLKCKGACLCNETIVKMEGKDNESIDINCLLQIYDLSKPKITGNFMLVKTQPSISVPSHNLGQIMEEAREKGLLTDVTLVTGKKEFKAHKAILAGQSLFFKTRFDQRWKQYGDQVVMNDVSPEILDVALKYMYTGELDKVDDVHSLYSFADQYDLETLRISCEVILLKELSDDNVVDVLILADTHNGKNLKKLCIEYIMRNLSKVKKSSAWSKLESKSEGAEKLRIEVFDACFNSLSV